MNIVCKKWESYSNGCMNISINEVNAFRNYLHIYVYVYTCVCVHVFNVRKFGCAVVCMPLFVVLKRASTTQEEYDKTVLQNHRYYGKQLICETCRHGDGRVDKNLYFCGRCNAFRDRGHFTKISMDNWKRRGKKENALKCKSDGAQSKSGDTSV